MKILHTADWHLGKIVNSVHMTEEQDYILEKLLDIIEQEQPDVLIIAGDIYDRAIPPRDAVELLNKVLTTIITTYNIPILAIAGNHDSPDRLEDRKSTRLNSSHVAISYAVFCLKKKNITTR